MTDLTPIADAQVQQFLHRSTLPVPEAQLILNRARTPAEIRRAILRERPVLDQLRQWPLVDPNPVQLRDEAVLAGALDAMAVDLEYRRLYPGLDVGVYCRNHAVGKPSVATAIALEEHRLELMTHGMGVFMDQGWLDHLDGFRNQVAELCGADLHTGDVTWYPNVSEGISAALAGLSGRLVTTEGHFTTAHYVHDLWSQRTGSAVVRVPIDADGQVPTERLVDALTPDTAVVSLTTALYKTGWMHDLAMVSAAMGTVCPDAVLVLDAYQTLGTVPIDATSLPQRTVILGGGVKQLRAGTGAAFGWYSNAALERIGPDRTGWWGHRDPMAMSHGPLELGERAYALRTGTPSFMPVVSLLAELRAFASSAGGELGAAVLRARTVTRANVSAAIESALHLGLDVQAGADPDRLAAFFAIRVGNGPQIVEALAEQGVWVDFRNDVPGGDAGVMRLSSSAAGFAYELEYAVDKVAELAR